MLSSNPPTQTSRGIGMRWSRWCKRALKRALAEQLGDAMHAGKRSKVAMAQRMATSRSQLDRVYGPANLSVQLHTLIKAANRVSKTVEIKLKRQFKPRSQTA